MANNHTPGPWVVRNIATRDHYIGPANDGGAPSIGFALSRVNSTEAQVSANARMMAAAPAMADALDCIVRRLQMDVDDGSRPDQWTMEDLIRTAKNALPAGWVIGGG